MNLVITNLSQKTAEIITLIAEKEGATVQKRSESIVSKKKRDPHFKELDALTNKLLKIVDKRMEDEKVNT